MLLERMQSGHLTGGWLGVSYGWIMPVPLLPFVLCKWIAMLVSTQVSSVLPSHVSSEEYGKQPSKHVKIGNRKKTKTF